MTRMLIATVAVVLTAGAAYGHHSYGAYFEDQTVTIEGTIEAIRFANPHVVLTLRTDAPAGVHARVAEPHSAPPRECRAGNVEGG